MAFFKLIGRSEETLALTLCRTSSQIESSTMLMFLILVSYGHLIISYLIGAETSNDFLIVTWFLVKVESVKKWLVNFNARYTRLFCDEMGQRSGLCPRVHKCWEFALTRLVSYKFGGQVSYANFIKGWGVFRLLSFNALERNFPQNCEVT